MEISAVSKYALVATVAAVAGGYLILCLWIASLELTIRRKDKQIAGLLDRIMAADYRVYSSVELRKGEKEQFGISPGGGTDESERGIPVY